MDIIRNYLITMFEGLPDTPAVRRAREELEAMMEDKYSELLAEGKSENEAVGTVISEFGNREELLQTLGIGERSRPREEDESASKAFTADSTDVQEEEETLHMVCTEEARDYVNAAGLSAAYRMIGVAMCIVSPVPMLFGDGRGIYEALAAAAFFLLVAGAVALFIVSGTVMRPWRYIKKDTCCLDEEARLYIENEKEAAYSSTSLLRTVGIAFCIFSIAPVIVFEYFSWNFLRMLGPALMFVIVAAGVAMIIYSTSKDGTYKKLLKLGTSRRKHKRTSRAHTAGTSGTRGSSLLRSSYWEIVTAVYLCYSFLTFNWSTSWLIWIIAALFRKPVLAFFGSEVSSNE